MDKIQKNNLKQRVPPSLETFNLRQMIVFRGNLDKASHSNVQY
jgi:hypothetical protein